jgi:hypothetical protein
VVCWLTLTMNECFNHNIRAGTARDTALSYGLDDRWFESRQGLGLFLFTTVSRTALGLTRLPIQWLSGALSLRLKRPDREVDHSSPPSAEVKNAWSSTTTPQYSFMMWCSVKAQGQPYLYLQSLDLLRYTQLPTIWRWVVSFTSRPLYTPG